MRRGLPHCTFRRAVTAACEDVLRLMLSNEEVKTASLPNPCLLQLMKNAFELLFIVRAPPRPGPPVAVCSQL